MRHTDVVIILDQFVLHAQAAAEKQVDGILADKVIS